MEVNTALTEDARTQGLIEDDQIVVLKKVFKQLRGDTTVEFQVYETSPDTDLTKAAGYRTADVKGDGTLTLTGTGSAVLVRDDADEITSLTVTPRLTRYIYKGLLQNFVFCNRLLCTTFKSRYRLHISASLCVRLPGIWYVSC